MLSVHFSRRRAVECSGSAVCGAPYLEITHMPIRNKTEKEAATPSTCSAAVRGSCARVHATVWVTVTDPELLAEEAGHRQHGLCKCFYVGVKGTEVTCCVRSWDTRPRCPCWVVTGRGRACNICFLIWERVARVKCVKIY